MLTYSLDNHGNIPLYEQLYRAINGILQEVLYQLMKNFPQSEI